MADKSTRVIDCHVDRLEDLMNQLEGPWACLAWHWREKPDGLHVVVVLGRMPSQPPVPIMMPNNFRPR